jgi:hypothetical protein
MDPSSLACSKDGMYPMVKMETIMNKVMIKSFGLS